VGTERDGPAGAGPYDGGHNGEYLNLNRAVLPDPPCDRLALWLLSHYTASKTLGREKPRQVPAAQQRPRPAGQWEGRGPRLHVQCNRTRRRNGSEQGFVLLTMRPTGGHSPVYADQQDWTIYGEGHPVGRIYEDSSASTSGDLRWFWSITVYDAGIVTSGKAATLDQAKAAFRGSLLAWVNQVENGCSR
jgi:hypothetical protein